MTQEPEKALLLIESLPSLAGIYKPVLAGAGYRLYAAGDRAQVLKICASVQPAVALVDMRQTGRAGLDLMQVCLDHHPDMRFIIVAANGAVESVVEAMRAGAFDYLVTPVDEKRLLSVVAQASVASRAPAHGLHTPPEVLGKSRPMLEVLDLIGMASQTDSPVFIQGDYGTGKDLCGRAIHARSARKNAPYRVLDCRGLSSERLRTALRDKDSLTSTGTLFLNEITKISASAQAELLSFIERAGTGSGQSPRLIAASTVCASTAVDVGQLNPSLHKALSAVSVTLPPLRERENDAVLIAKHALRKARSRTIQGDVELCDEAADCMRRYPWPGNVRQLIYLMRDVSTCHPGQRVTPGMLPHEITEGVVPFMSGFDLVGRSMAEIERVVIEATISRQSGSVPRAAAILGLSPSTLYRKRDSWRGLRAGFED